MREHIWEYVVGGSLCFLGFLPLWVIVLFIEIRNCMVATEFVFAEKCAIAGIVIGFAITARVVFCWLRDLRPKNKGEERGTPYVFKQILELKTLTAEMLLTYVLPLLAFDFTKWEGLTQFLVFFVVVAWLVGRHHVVTGNVYLELIGYHFYDCIVIPANGWCCQHVKVLSKQSLEGKELEIWRLVGLNDQVKMTIGVENAKTTKACQGENGEKRDERSVGCCSEGRDLCGKVRG